MWTHFVDTFFNEPELILLYTVKWFQVFLLSMNISIYYLSFVCTQLSGFKYCYVSLTIHQSFLYTQSTSVIQLIDQIVIFLKIQFNISDLFALSLNVKQFYLTLSGATTLGQSGPGSDDNEGVLYIPQCFSITGAIPSDCLVLYPRHSLWGVGLTHLQRCSQCILLCIFIYLFIRIRS